VSALARWRDPNLEEARQAVTRIVKEGNRASEVIRRIRSLMKKNPPQMAPLDINELIGEVLLLTQHEIVRNGVRRGPNSREISPP